MKNVIRYMGLAVGIVILSDHGLMHTAQMNLVEQAGASARVTQVQQGQEVGMVGHWQRPGIKMQQRVVALPTAIDSEFIEAATAGDFNCMVSAYRQGANANAQDINGNTALMHAVVNGHTRIVDFLIALRAPSGDLVVDINAWNYSKQTALMLAPTETIARALLAREDIIVGLRDQLGSTVLIDFLENKFYGAAVELLKRKADVNVYGQYGMTPLMLVVKQGYVDMARHLCELGADVNAHNNIGKTPLMFAVLGKYAQYPEMMSLLLAKGADVNARNDNGRTPLMMAAAIGRKDAFALLMSSGAQLDAQDNAGKTALMLADEACQENTVLQAEEKENKTAPGQQKSSKQVIEQKKVLVEKIQSNIR